MDSVFQMLMLTLMKQVKPQSWFFISFLTIYTSILYLLVLVAPLPPEIFAAASMSFCVEKSAVIMRNEARKLGVSLCKLKHSGFWNFLANDTF